MASGIVHRDPLNCYGTLTSADVVNSKLDLSDPNVTAFWLVRNGICFVRLSDIKTTQTSYSFGKVLTNLPPTSQGVYAHDLESKVEFSIYPGDSSGDIYLKTNATFTVGAKLPHVTLSYPVDYSWYP